MAGLPAKGNMDVNAGHSAGGLAFALLCDVLAMQKYLLLLLLIAGSGLHALGQAKVLVIESPEGLNPRIVTNPVVPIDGEEMIPYIMRPIVQALYRDGHLQAAWYTEARGGDTVAAILVPGGRYQLKALSPGNLDPGIWPLTDFKPAQWHGRPLRPEDWERQAARIIRYYEEHGYPFISLRLDSVQLQGDSISAAMNVAPGPFITWDTIQVFGNANINRRFLEKYLGIEPDRPYNEQRIRQLRLRLQGLRYLSSTQPPEVIFVRDKARIRLYLRDQQASRFNFLIGILPNSDQRGGRLLVNGEANLHLLNPFGSGRAISMEWRSLQPRSPQLHAALEWPFVLQSDIGLEGQFHLFKRDTFWLDVEGLAGIRYFFPRGDVVRVFMAGKTSNLITVDTALIRSSGRLPSRLDVGQNQLGISLRLDRLNYPFNPRSGWLVDATVAAGSRRIKRNANIMALTSDDLDVGALYDSLGGASLALSVTAAIDRFWPLGRYATVRTAYRGGWVEVQSLLENELLRIGGNALMRGFDEESLLTAWYHMLNVEWRYLLDRNAYFALFAEGGPIRRKALDTFVIDYPIGIGAGLAFETTAGVFEVSYAMGRLNAESPFEFRKARIHFGYVSYF